MFGHVGQSRRTDLTSACVLSFHLQSRFISCTNLPCSKRHSAVLSSLHPLCVRAFRQGIRYNNSLDQGDELLDTAVIGICGTFTPTPITVNNQHEHTCAVATQEGGRHAGDTPSPQEPSDTAFGPCVLHRSLSVLSTNTCRWVAKHNAALGGAYLCYM